MQWNNILKYTTREIQIYSSVLQILIKILNYSYLSKNIWIHFFICIYLINLFNLLRIFFISLWNFHITFCKINFLIVSSFLFFFFINLKLNYYWYIMINRYSHIREMKALNTIEMRFRKLFESNSCKKLLIEIILFQC